MLHKTELLKVTVEDLDTETAAPAAPVNILREKTFNPELSSLLDKIYSHEKVAVTETPKHEGMDPGLKISLLQKCDQLIYRLKHESELASVTSEFNPFSLDINVYDEIDDLNDYIQAGMSQSGFGRFLVMKYNFKDAAFRTELNRIDERLTSDLFFSTRDPLFKHMYEKNEGCIITNSSIIEDPFMQKKLGHIFLQEDIHGAIYFVRLCSLCEDDEKNSMLKRSMNLFEQYLSPIIAVIPDEERDFYDNREIFETLKRNMQIPFSLYIMKNMFRFDSAGFSYEDALLMLELYMNSPAGSEMSRSILTLDNFSSKENIFILKYLLSRIRKRLEKNSFFMRISIDKCLLIASEGEKKDIIGMIDEINSWDKIISLTPADNSVSIDRNSFASLFL